MTTTTHAGMSPIEYPYVISTSYDSSISIGFASTSMVRIRVIPLVSNAGRSPGSRLIGRALRFMFCRRAFCLMIFRLMKMAKRVGCAVKQPSGYLMSFLGRFLLVIDPNVLVGSDIADDAAIYRLSDDIVFVFTIDFFTSIVDDPYEFGAVVVVNAFFDVYAMGGCLFMVLNFVGFFDVEFDVVVFAEILRGGVEKAKEVGIDIVGGYMIKSDEPIYGFVVIGMVYFDRVVINVGVCFGDRFVFIKSIGFGILMTVVK